MGAIRLKFVFLKHTYESLTKQFSILIWKSVFATLVDPLKHCEMVIPFVGFPEPTKLRSVHFAALKFDSYGWYTCSPLSG